MRITAVTVIFCIAYFLSFLNVYPKINTLIFSQKHDTILLDTIHGGGILIIDNFLLGG